MARQIRARSRAAGSPIVRTLAIGGVAGVGQRGEQSGRGGLAQPAMPCHVGDPHRGRRGGGQEVERGHRPL
jgi:hypothetical protein